MLQVLNFPDYTLCEKEWLAETDDYRGLLFPEFGCIISTLNLFYGNKMDG